MNSDVIKRLREHSASIRAKRQDLSDALAQYELILDAYESTPEVQVKPDPHIDLKAEPMAGLTALQIDWRQSLDLFRRIKGILNVKTDFPGDAETRDSHEAELLERSFKAFAARAKDDIPADKDVSPGMELAAALTVRPLLRTIFSEARAGIDKESTSYKPRCPVCGARPVLSKITDPDGVRFLVCSVCEAEWPYQRLKCTACGCSDHKKFEQLVADDDAVTALFLCNECESYMKSIDTRGVESEFDALLYSIMTAHWDYIASNRGYGSASPLRAIDASN